MCHMRRRMHVSHEEEDACVTSPAAWRTCQCNKTAK